MQGSGRDSGNWRVVLGGIWAMIPKLILESHVWQELSQSQGKPCAKAVGVQRAWVLWGTAWGQVEQDEASHTGRGVITTDAAFSVTPRNISTTDYIMLVSLLREVDFILKAMDNH